MTFVWVQAKMGVPHVIDETPEERITRQRAMAERIVTKSRGPRPTLYIPTVFENGQLVKVDADDNNGLSQDINIVLNPEQAALIAGFQELSAAWDNDFAATLKEIQDAEKN
jgi:hypothetical protein